MSRKVNLGVVGCGVIAQHHLKHATASPLINIRAVADIRKEAATATASKFGVERVYTNADDLFDDPDIEGVVLALQTAYRTELAFNAFAKGKHVLLEKPVAMNAQDVVRMIQARGPLLAGCCSSRFRLFDSARAAAELVATGALGELRVVRCRNIAPGSPPKGAPFPWQYRKGVNGGGVLADWGVYDLDYVMGITGWTLRPQTVLARTWTIAPQYESYIDPGSDAETQTAAFIVCENGTVINFERGTQVPAAREHAWQIVGTNGSLDLYLLPKDEKEIVFHEASTPAGTVSRTIWKGTETWPSVNGGPMLDFASAILENRQPSTGLEQSLLIQKVIDAIYLSSETRRAVILS